MFFFFYFEPSERNRAHGMYLEDALVSVGYKCTFLEMGALENRLFKIHSKLIHSRLLDDDVYIASNELKI